MTIDFDFDDARPGSWADAFPWLAGASHTGRVHWWQESMDGIDPMTRSKRLATISELAMERLSRWTIGEIFPALSPNVDLLRLGLPTRAVNALVRLNCSTSGQLMSLTPDDMMGWRQVGVGTVDAILQALADISTSLSTPTVTSNPETAQPNHEIAAETTATLGWVSKPADDLRLIATWCATIGLRGQPLLAGPIPPGSPDEVVQARQRLETLTPSDVLSAAELASDVGRYFDDALGLLDPRALGVLCSRLFGDDPMTLDQLAQIHGVTRERIRQIEGKARGTMLSVISDAGPLSAVAHSARELIGTIRPLDDLLELIPALGQNVARADQPAWRVLDRLDDAYEIEDGWCVVPTMTAARTLTQTRLEERADPYGAIRLDEVDFIESSHPERLRELSAAWLTHCGYILHGEFALTRTSSVGDYAAAILSIEGSPLSAQEIIDRFAFERSVGSTRNAMSTDERFDRVDRDRWALSEWGMDVYSGIRSVIRELVAHSGGRARLNDVVEYITERYSVSGNSVVAYAAAAPFITQDGIVRLDGGARSARKSPESTRRLFRRPDGWVYRIRVTTDHLRGSGSVAPMAIATILNLQPGETVQLESRLGPQSVAWTGIQPAFGTIRRFLMDGDVPADTEAFLVLNDGGTFDLECTRDLANNPLADALALTGAPEGIGGEEARVALARAVKLPDESPTSSVIGAYRSRGDEDIADLLLSARDYLETGEEPSASRSSPKVNEIMDLL